MLKRELVEKYKNALPHDTSESTFGEFCFVHASLGIANQRFTSKLILVKRRIHLFRSFVYNGLSYVVLRFPFEMPEILGVYY